MEDVGLIDDLHQLRHRGALLGVSYAQPVGVQIHVLKQVGKQRVGILDVVKRPLELLTLEGVLADLLRQRTEGQSRLDDIAAGLPQVGEQVLGVFVLVGLLVFLLRLFDGIRGAVVEQVVDLDKEGVGEVFVENEAEQVVLVLVGVHFGSQDIGTRPEDGFQFFSVVGHGGSPLYCFCLRVYCQSTQFILIIHPYS